MLAGPDSSRCAGMPPAAAIVDAPAAGAARSGLESLLFGFVGLALLIVSGSIVARLLGVEARGRLAALSVVPTMLSAFGFIGVPAALTFYVGKDPREAWCYIRTSYRMVCALSLLLVPIGLAVASFVSPPHGSAIGGPGLLAVLAIPPLLVHQIGISALQGRRAFRALQWMRLTPAAVYAAIAAAFLIFDVRELRFVVLGWLVAQTTAAALSTGIVYRTWKDRGPASWARAGLLLRFGTRGHLASGSQIEAFSLDQMLLALIAPPHQLGLYAVATAFANVPRLMSRSCSLVLYPSVVVARSAEDRTRLVLGAAIAIAGTNVLFIGCLAPLLPALIVFFFGEDFRPAASIALPLLVAAGLGSTRQVLFDGLRGLGAPQWASMAEISMYPVVGALAWRWVPVDGARGLAIALGAGFALSLGVAAIFLIELLRRERVPDDPPAA